MKDTTERIDTRDGHVHSRTFRLNEDFELVRQFLTETYPLMDWAHNWEIRRWEGFCYDQYSDQHQIGGRPWESTVRLWETEDGRLVGVVHPEGGGDAHLQIHPDFRRLEDDMLVWAEENLAVPTEDGQQRRLTCAVCEYDTERHEVIRRRGYKKQAYGGYSRRRPMDIPIPEIALAVGYVLRALDPDDNEDPARVATIVRECFGHTNYSAEGYRWFETTPSYRHDLHIAAVAPDGSFAAFCGVTFEPVNRYGVFEPVCTHPDHRRKGLARAVMLEGLRRLRALGATHALVGTGDGEGPNRLYEALGFGEFRRVFVWKKTF